MTAVMPAGVGLARDIVGPAMEAAVSRLSPEVRRVSAYHLGMTDAEGNPRADGAGKALRPALALLSARAAPPDPAAGRALAATHTWSAAAAAHLPVMPRFAVPRTGPSPGSARRWYRPRG